jgi:hypothetical protein
MHAEVVCDLLVRITSCRLCRDDGGISVWRMFHPVSRLTRYQARNVVICVILSFTGYGVKCHY